MSAKALAEVLHRIETDLDVVCTCHGEHRSSCPKRLAREALREHGLDLVEPFRPMNLAADDSLVQAVARAMYERPGLERAELFADLSVAEERVYIADARRALAVVDAEQERLYLAAQRKP